VGQRAKLPLASLVSDTLAATPMTSMGNSSFNARALLRGSPIRGLVLVGVLLVAGVVVGTAMMVNVFRERALQSAERELGNTASLLARHFDQKLDDFITIQRKSRSRFARQN
jgi:hypothetical protein